LIHFKDKIPTALLVLIWTISS